MKTAVKLAAIVCIALLACGLWAQEIELPESQEEPVVLTQPAAATKPPAEDGVAVETITSYLDKMSYVYRVNKSAKIPEIELLMRGNNVNYAVSIVIYDPIKVVYLSMDRIMTVPDQHPRKAVLLQRLMELNWEHFLAKYEWEKRNGEVRLSYSFSTENGLGYDAFAACFEHLILTADHDYPKLMRLMWAEEKEAPAPTTVVPPESRPEETAKAKETEPKPETKTKATEPKPEAPASPEQTGQP